MKINDTIINLNTLIIERKKDLLYINMGLIVYKPIEKISITFTISDENTRF